MQIQPFWLFLQKFLKTSKPITNNTRPPTITTLQWSIDSQDFFIFSSLSREVNASSNCVPNRLLLQELGEEKFIPLKKIKLTKESMNKPLIIRQAVAGEEDHWITKKLTRSDVNGASTLLLPRQEVNNVWIYCIVFRHYIISRHQYCEWWTYKKVKTSLHNDKFNQR